MTANPTIERISAAAEHRGGRDARRADGAFFTSNDVAEWLARRAISARLLVAAGREPSAVDALLARGIDMRAELRSCVRADPTAVPDLRDRLTRLRVLDPSCGAGAFLVAAWHELRAVEALLDESDRNVDARRVSADQLIGIDVDAAAIDAAAAVLDLVAASGAVLHHADALALDVALLAPVDIMLGNPPYVRRAPADAPRDVSGADAANMAAWIVERWLRALAPSARVAMVLPISAASTAAWGMFRTAWDQACAATHAAHFDAIPSALFADAVQRISLFEGRVLEDVADDGARQWYTTRYHRWLRRERADLLDHVRYVPLTGDHDPSAAVPKVGTRVERELLAKVQAQPPLGRWFARGAGSDNVMYYKRRWSYFLLFADFVPPIWDADGTPRQPSELQEQAMVDGVPARAVIAICSSTLFWWWFSARTDNRNVNRGELRAFGVPDLDADQLRELDELGTELMSALHACGEVRECTYRSVGTIRNTYYRQAATRPVLDRIDAALARAYGMRDEELAAVLAFEQRFRS